jgi:hypothetical protein
MRCCLSQLLKDLLDQSTNVDSLLLDGVLTQLSEVEQVVRET